MYLLVMGPICGLMVFLLANDTKPWMKWSAAVVLFFSLFGFFKGYLRRLQLSERGARLVRPFGTIDIPWPQAKRVGAYIPGGGVGAVEYIYITTRDEPPAGKWDIDRETIQVQGRPGLLEAIEKARDSAGDRAEIVES